MAHYDFFIAGRWRNYAEVNKVLKTVRAHRNTAYCFIENLYEGSKVEFKQDASIENIMQQLESLPDDDEFVHGLLPTVHRSSSHPRHRTRNRVLVGFVSSGRRGVVAWAAGVT